MSTFIEKIKELEAGEVVTRKVLTPKWPDKHVFVKEILLGEFDRIEKLSKDSSGEVSESRALAAFCVVCACTEDGTPLFTEDDHAELLLRKCATVKFVGEEASRLNKASPDEDLVGNSKGDQTEDTSSS